MHEGHRQRLIAKLEEGTLCDHEYLEMLLFNALPRKNTNDIAHRLLAEFGSLNKVFAAKPEQLCKVEGVGKSVASYLQCLSLAIQAYVDKKIVALPKKFEPQSFLTFVKNQYESATKEILDMYFIDGEGAVYKRVGYTTQSLYSVIVEPDELVSTFLKEKTSGIVLVHTHPSGNMQPSAMDDKTTQNIQKLCYHNGVLLCDHVIYSSRGMYSYYLSGKLHELLWDWQKQELAPPAKTATPTASAGEEKLDESVSRSFSRYMKE